MVVVNWSTGDAELIPFIWKKINLRTFVSDIYDGSPFTISSLSIGIRQAVLDNYIFSLKNLKENVIHE